LASERLDSAASWMRSRVEVFLYTDVKKVEACLVERVVERRFYVINYEKIWFFGIMC
jgi:hypothetical protein